MCEQPSPRLPHSLLKRRRRSSVQRSRTRGGAACVAASQVVAETLGAPDPSLVSVAVAVLGANDPLPPLTTGVAGGSRRPEDAAAAAGATLLLLEESAGTYHGGAHAREISPWPYMSTCDMW